MKIAEIYEQDGQADKALDWAERGLKAFPNRTDNRLRDFLVAAYLQNQRYAEAIHLTWIQFDEVPVLENYKKLYRVAERTGSWPEQRECALVRATNATAKPPLGFYRSPAATGPDFSLRVEIALWEKDLETAWAAANSGACDNPLLLTLAENLSDSRPDDAITLYQRVIPLIVEQTNNTAYADAIKLIKQVRKLMQPPHRHAEFFDYVAELRVRFKAKRNFIKLLAGVEP